MHTRVTSLLELFDLLDIKFGDPPRPHKWVVSEYRFFGAYLAGIIDGDGTVTIRKSKYPQCSIKISSGEKQLELVDDIRKLLKCSVWIISREGRHMLGDRIFDSQWVDLEFLVSSKTYQFFEKFVLPFIQLGYKKSKIESYISSRWITN